MARDADCRCWATESAISFRAASRSFSVVKISVVRSGTPARGSSVGGFASRSLVEVAGNALFERGEGDGGGRVADEEGLSRGVDCEEDIAE